MGLPVYFRVTELHGDEYGHRVTLQEYRVPLSQDKSADPRQGQQALGRGAGLAPSVETPPSVLVLSVTAQTFGSLSVGQEFGMAPRMESETTKPANG